jgi:Zn-dependent peptidase ImmA (M78 family)
MGVAEKQAYKFLNLTGCSQPSEITEAIEALPRVRVESIPDLPSSGASDWIGSTWLILLNADDAPVRQRFSSAHEFKHILDHPFRKVQPWTRHGDETAEIVCDYFAGCLLIPRPWLKRAWTSETQQLGDLARLFGVSRQAMRVRLLQTGLVDPIAQRCSQIQRLPQRPRPRYYRARSEVHCRSLAGTPGP